jgi:prepilin-type N-terminal cleavage/methylation domain-containing protein
MKQANPNLGRPGFTLVELLVSMAILSILLLALAQMMNFVSNIWLNGIGAVDNFTKARVILNLLDRDIQMMVLRPDMAAFVDGATPAQPACAFYTNVQGNSSANPSNTRAVSLVQYSLLQSPSGSPTSSVLQRSNEGMDFLGASGTTPALITSLATTNLVQLGSSGSPNTTLQPEILSTGVIFFQWQFVDGTGAIQNPTSSSLAFVYDYTNRSASSNYRSVVVSIVVLSNSAYKLAIQTGALTTLTGNSIFSTAPPMNKTYSDVWNSELSSPNTAFLSLPAPIRTGILVFKRQIPLPTPAS